MKNVMNEQGKVPPAITVSLVLNQIILNSRKQINVTPWSNGHCHR